MEGKNWIETSLNIRRILIVFEMPLLYDHDDILHMLLSKLINMNKEVSDIIKLWISTYDAERFKHLVISLREKADILVINNLNFNNNR